jgi:hypothetical protein
MPREPIRDKPARKKTYGLRLDHALMKELAHLAVDEDKWVNEMMDEAVRDLLKKYKEKRPK